MLEGLIKSKESSRQPTTKTNWRLIQIQDLKESLLEFLFPDEKLDQEHQTPYLPDTSTMIAAYT
jgi:hypothetical protein